MSKGEVTLCGFKLFRNVAGFPTIELSIMNTTALRKMLHEANFENTDELVEAIEFTQQKLAELSNELEDRYGVI